MMNKQHFLSRWKERGNIFFTLFAAVGVVGALGVGSTTLLKGPVQTMVKINQKQVTEEYAELGLRVMMANVLNADANCDGDNKLEAAEWEDPTPPFTAPTGGGVFPSAYGTKVTDPWGRHLGYCVWDHGSLIDDAGCGGGTQKRLRGAASDDTQPFITVISAGPNQVFETSCNDYVDVLPGPADGDPDTPLIVKPTNSDDLIVNYSTIDAQQAMGDNWVFTSNETADGDAATTDQNLDFAQDVTFSGLLDLNKLGGGLTLPDFSTATCDGTTEGQLFRDSATTPPAVMVCDGGTFKAMSGSSSNENYAYNFDPENPNCTLNNGGPFILEATIDTPSSARDVWVDGSYIYVADNATGIIAYSFNGSTFTEIDRNTPGSGGSRDIWSDGTYVYVGENSNGIRAYTFDGSAFTEEGHLDTTGNTNNIWGDGTYIYAQDTNTLIAYTFDGSTFTQEGTYVTPNDITSIWGDGTYIYIGNNGDGVRAYTFDGSTFTEEGFIDPTGNIAAVWGDGTYVYAANSGEGLRAYSFDGSTFTELDQIDNTSGTARGVWGDGTYIYLSDNGDGISAYTFDGSSFTSVDQDTPGSVDGYRVSGDGTYIYLADGNQGLHAYSGFECLSTTPDYSDRPDAPNTGVDYNYRSYGWGEELYGELGNGSALTGDQVSPTLVLGDNEFFQVSARGGQACGLKTDGSAWCWGADNAGQMGNGDTITANQETSYPVSGGHKFIKINVGFNNVCALKENGTVWCWGADNSGQMGNGVGNTPHSEPAQVSGLSNIIDIAVNSTSPCALEINGTTWCWGDDGVGELGNGTTSTSQHSPVQVDTNIKFIQISNSPSNACGLTETGSIWCWGDNNNGEVGNGTTSAIVHSPEKVIGMSDFIKVSVGSSHTCGLRENGEIWCWGDDNSGQLGNGPSVTGDQTSPTKVVNIDDFVDLSTATNATCAIRSNGTAWCWGRDNLGQLGNGAGLTGNQESPTQVENLTNVTDISCMSDICIAATKEPKQMPEIAPTAPVIIEQKTSAGNTAGSHGLAINYNSTTNTEKVGLAFKIDAEDTAAGDEGSAQILGRYGTNGGMRIRLNDGTGLTNVFRMHENGAANINTLTTDEHPKLSINSRGSVNWIERFDTGLLISDLIGANQSAFYGIDSTTGNAVILSGEDLLIQHSSTDGATVTPIAYFENTGVPEFYGDMIMSGNNRTATISAYTDTADETAAFKFLRYRGTEGAETAVVSGDMLGSINFKGFDGTDYNANSAGRIFARSGGASPGNVGSRLFISKENGTGNGSINIRINYGGDMSIGSPIASGALAEVAGRTTADNAVKAGLDPTCASADDEGTLRFTGTEYEYCKDDGGGGYFWESVVTEPTCQDDAKIHDVLSAYRRTCLLYDNGELACWGENGGGDMGNGNGNDPEYEILPIDAMKSKQVGFGRNHTCAIDQNDKIKCWGQGVLGRLGNGQLGNLSYPASIASNKTYKKIANGHASSCAIQTSGQLDCWGANGNGQLGAGNTIQQETPQTVSSLSNVIDITAGKYHHCALLSDRTVRCWGDNDDGQIGNGTTSPYETSPQQPTITDVLQISAGGFYDGALDHDGTCALKSDGTVWCWGSNHVGQIGNGTSGAVSVTTPTQVTGITNAIQISRIGGSACALLDNKTIKCWGRGTYGELGNGSSTSQSTPVTVSGISNAVKLTTASSGVHMCALLTDGTAQCWGNNTNGQLGDGTTTDSNTPVDVISPLSCAADKYVFVTSDTYDGNMGGLKGADNICQAHADRANLPGRYMAWLSDNTGTPSTRFNRITTNYKRVDEVVIANGWLDLTDGNIDNAITLFEDGNPLPTGSVWSNTDTDGTLLNSSQNCNNWTTNSVAKSAAIGFTNTNNTWTDNSNTTSCSTLAVNFYCFQQ